MIVHEVLGRPGGDNVLWARIETGQKIHRLLFDCGSGCIGRLGVSEIQSISHLFFSHFHMDHVAGFDGFFRLNYNRDGEPIHVWGPPGTIDVMHHRFRGFWWNLHSDQPGHWIIHDVHPDRIESAGFKTREAFAIRHDEKGQDDPEVLVHDADFEVRALLLDHHGPSAAYRVDEPTKQNVNPDKLRASGLKPGPWMQQLKNAETRGAVRIGGREHDLEALRADLIEESPGQSIAYLTDFRLDDATRDILVPWLTGCDRIVCEAQYAHEDLELATKHAHSTTRQVATLAQEAGVGVLELFHLSKRYPDFIWKGMLQEARAVFPATEFPKRWTIG